jgi:hypothetical protein
MHSSTSDTYTAFMEGKGQTPETVQLAHGAVGHWVGDKNAKNVLIFYHGECLLHNPEKKR